MNKVSDTYSKKSDMKRGSRKPLRVGTDIKTTLMIKLLFLAALLGCSILLPAQSATVEYDRQAAAVR